MNRTLAGFLALSLIVTLFALGGAVIAQQDGGRPETPAVDPAAGRKVDDEVLKARIARRCTMLAWLELYEKDGPDAALRYAKAAHLI